MWKVKGMIECIYCHDDNTCVVANEEAKLIGMEGNRRFGDGNSIIAGPFFVVGLEGDGFRSLTEEEQAKYLEEYAEPEQISQMRIPPEDLEWYAAFHNEGSHPHVHMIAYSKGKEPYMTRKGLENLKSAYANEVFKQDLYHVFVEQTQLRDELREEGKKKAAELVEKIKAGGYENERAETLLKSLAEKLKDYKGKRVYGYLPKDAKNLVDGIVEELAKDERLQELYKLWYQEKDEIVGTYQDAPANRVPLSQNEEFKSIRNAVVKEAFHYLYPDKKNKSSYTPPSAASAVVRLFHHLARAVQNRLDDYYSRKHNSADKKLRRMIDEKKKAQGLKQE